jgi:heterotetrameric sarcosine oxidase delta subunit
MLRIPCPWCGERAEIEFQNTGEVIARPPDPLALDDVAWSGYLFERANRKGFVRENWWHQHGCRQWFELERDTATNAFRARPAAGANDDAA